MDGAGIVDSWKIGICSVTAIYTISRASWGQCFYFFVLKFMDVINDSSRLISRSKHVIRKLCLVENTHTQRRSLFAHGIGIDF